MPDRFYDEHMLVEKQDGTLWMLLRLKTGIGEAFSSDGGKTWREVRKSGIWGLMPDFLSGGCAPGACSWSTCTGGRWGRIQRKKEPPCRIFI